MEMNELDAVKIGSSSAIGGFMGWLISYLKSKDNDKKIEGRMTKDQCDERHKAVDAWRVEMKDDFNRFDKKLDDIRELIIRK